VAEVFRCWVRADRIARDAEQKEATATHA